MDLQEESGAETGLSWGLLGSVWICCHQGQDDSGKFVSSGKGKFCHLVPHFSDLGVSGSSKYHPELYHPLPPRQRGGRKNHYGRIAVCLYILPLLGGWGWGGCLETKPAFLFLWFQRTQGRYCYTEWSKWNRERQTSYDITYMWNLKNGTKDLIYKTRNRVSDVDNKFMVARQVRGGKGKIRRLGLPHTLYYV